jgi:hypothetical protein
MRVRAVWLLCAGTLAVASANKLQIPSGIANAARWFASRKTPRGCSIVHDCITRSLPGAGKCHFAPNAVEAVAEALNGTIVNQDEAVNTILQTVQQWQDE